MVASVCKDGGDQSWDDSISEHRRSLACRLHRVPTGKLGEGASSAFIDSGRDSALGAFRLEGEDLPVRAALWVAKVIAVAAVDRTLEHTVVPAVVHIRVVPIPCIVSVCKYKWLVRVLRLRTISVECTSVPVDLHENSGDANRELGIGALSRVGATRSVGNVGLVVGGVDVLAVPAAGEVDLRPDT